MTDPHEVAKHYGRPRLAEVCAMSALPPKADICWARCDVRFVPKADSCPAAK
jgi:hypothetical protein